jgi:hypothetical protein
MYENNNLISVMNEDDVHNVELKAFENVNNSSISEIKDIMSSIIKLLLKYHQSICFQFHYKIQ